MHLASPNQEISNCIKFASYIDEKESVDEQVSNKLQTFRLFEAIGDVLGEREKTVIRMRYGIGGDEFTQREVADLLNISRSYVSRIEKKALSKIGKEMDDYKL